MNVKQKPAALIIDRESEIILVLDYLLPAAHEAALLAAPDEILQRASFPSHLRPPWRTTPCLSTASHQSVDQGMRTL